MRNHSATKKINRRISVKKTKGPSLVKRFVVMSQYLLAVGGIALALGVVGFYGSQAVFQFLNKPIASVSVSGDFRYIEKEQISQLINDNISHSFMQENLTALRTSLEEHPWVDRVSLRRQWPDKLVVNITEQKPIARWSDSGFVNYRGELIFLENNESVSNLPQLEGDSSRSLQIMKQYQLLSQTLAGYQLTIYRLQQNKLGMWEIELSNGWHILAGRTDIVQKMQRLMQLIAQGKISQQQPIASIDMRYQNGLAIRWHKNEENAQQLSIRQQHYAKNI